MMPNMTVMAPKMKGEKMPFAVHAAGSCAIRYPKGTAYQGLEEFDSPIRLEKEVKFFTVEKTALLSVGSTDGVCRQGSAKN